MIRIGVAGWSRMASYIIRRRAGAAALGMRRPQLQRRGPTCCQRRGLAAASGPKPAMRFASAAAIADCDITPQNPFMVVEEILEQLTEQLGGEKPDLLLFFNATSRRAPLDGKDLANLLREAVVADAGSGPAAILGTSWDCDGRGTGVVGGPPTADGCEEVHEIPAVTVLGAVLPDVRILPFVAEPDHDGLPILHSGSWPELAMLPEAEAAHVLLFSCCSSTQGAEPYSARHSLPQPILQYFDNALPFSAKVGGLVPRGTTAKNPVIDIGSQLGEAAGGLITIDCDDGEHVVSTQGIGGIVLEGNVEVDTIVCQGAAGFGPVYEITKCKGSYILEMDGQPAAGVIVDQLRQGRERHAEQVFASETGQAGRGGGGDMAAWRSPVDEEGYGGEPADTLRIVAGVALDDRATRDGGTDAHEEQSGLPSMRVSSEFVVRRIVHVDREAVSGPAVLCLLCRRNRGRLNEWG